VHTHSSKAGFLGQLAAWLCRTPLIVHTIHGFAWHDFLSRRRRTIYDALERLVRPVTLRSPQVAREAVAVGMGPSANIFVVPSAVELDEFPDGADQLIRAELGIPEDVPLVGTVGRLDFQKAPLDFARMASPEEPRIPRHVSSGWAKATARGGSSGTRRLEVDSPHRLVAAQFVRSTPHGRARARERARFLFDPALMCGLIEQAYSWLVGSALRGTPPSPAVSGATARLRSRLGSG
jgi:hypothetical protein